MRNTVRHVFRQEPQELRQDRQISSHQPGALSQSLLSYLSSSSSSSGSLISRCADSGVCLTQSNCRVISVSPAPHHNPDPFSQTGNSNYSSSGAHLFTSFSPSPTWRQVAPADSYGVQSRQSEMKHGSKLKLSLGHICFPFFLARQFLCTRTRKLHTHQYTFSPSRSFLSRPSDPLGTLILPLRHCNPLMSSFLSLFPLFTFFLCIVLLFFCLKDTINYLFLEQTHWSFL